ncbi:hypothetical protein [Paenibacillus typhae]|uniref:hypothetical protein n=1 Tax=Paenibacillus typhae TaxID=1174501 RepID=UPI001C8E9B9F|nr:hypothetical protein [Paenibacillus typhae]MBY0011504.1 hypothetical protein [Paenibacillus typhae]
MYPISTIYADYLRGFDHEFLIKALIVDKEYDSSKIVDFTIDASIVSNGEFEIGTAIPAKLTIRLRAAEEIPANARIIPYISLSLARMTWQEANIAWEDDAYPWIGGNTEWLPLGEFHVDGRDKVNDVWTYECYDKLVFADQPYISSLTYPTTQQAVFDEICSRLGYTYNSSVFINPSYAASVAPTGFSMRQVLAYIAGANCGSLFFGKDGVLRMKRFVPEAPVFNYSRSDYIRAKQTNPLKSYTRVVVTYDTEDDLSYEAGSGDENHTLYLENPLATQAIVNALQASLSGVSYLPYDMDSRGFPQLDIGDRVGIGLYEGASWMETITAWEDTDLPWTGIAQYESYILHSTLSFKGGIALKVEAPSVSEQQSEFVVPGTLTEAVNNLDKTALKEKKRYYGATITREQGLVIQVQDANAKAVFNADELSFYNDDGQRALWFDIPNNEYMFSGTITASKIISPEIEGGTIQIGSGENVFKASDWGIWLGASAYANAPFKVDVAGHMDAVDGRFSGLIEASTINGGTITGALIQTSSDGSYPYAAMSSSNRVFKVAASSSVGIEMRSLGDNSLADFFFTNGGTYSSLSLPSSGLYLNGNAGLTMEFANIYLRGYNGAYVSRWSDFRSEETGASLQSELNTLVSLITSAAINMSFDTTTRNLKLFSMTGAQLAIVNIPK